MAILLDRAGAGTRVGGDEVRSLQVGPQVDAGRRVGSGVGDRQRVWDRFVGELRLDGRRAADREVGDGFVRRRHSQHDRPTGARRAASLRGHGDGVVLAGRTCVGGQRDRRRGRPVRAGHGQREPGHCRRDGVPTRDRVGHAGVDIERPASGRQQRPTRGGVHAVHAGRRLGDGEAPGDRWRRLERCVAGLGRTDRARAVSDGADARAAAEEVRRPCTPAAVVELNVTRRPDEAVAPMEKPGLWALMGELIGSNAIV